VKALGESELKAKEKAELVGGVFGIKLNQAKKFVYANTVSKDKSIPANEKSTLLKQKAEF